MNAARRRLFLAPALALALLGLLAGCASPVLPGPPPRVPTNVRGPDTWPLEIRRVAVLPIHDASGGLPAEFVAAHDDGWRRALATSQRAEFITVSRATLTTLAGRATLDASAPLPPGLPRRVADHTGADALLFLDLVQATPYPPLSLAVRARLVRPDDNETIWMADEIFDARDPGAVRALNNDSRARAQGPGDPTVASLQSPLRFADHAFRAVAGLLPPRRPILEEKAQPAENAAK